MRKILVPVRGDGKGGNVLAHAATLARRYKAHVQITHCRARPEDLMPFGVPIPGFLKKQLIDNAAELADQVERELLEETRTLAAEFGLDMKSQAAPGAITASWSEDAGRQIDVIKRHGRLADLICVAKPDIDRNLGANTLKSALFSTGRPVLMCPDAGPVSKTLGGHVAIAWNGSMEASRAIALTAGIIEDADRVSILTAGKELHGATTSDLVDYLLMRGVQPSVASFEPGGSLGKSLLKAARDAGADLLIMGAYGDSHEAETVFGGNTQAVVDSADMPVILAH